MLCLTKATLEGTCSELQRCGQCKELNHRVTLIVTYPLVQGCFENKSTHMNPSLCAAFGETRNWLSYVAGFLRNEWRNQKNCAYFSFEMKYKKKTVPLSFAILRIRFKNFISDLILMLFCINWFSVIDCLVFQSHLMKKWIH